MSDVLPNPYESTVGPDTVAQLATPAPDPAARSSFEGLIGSAHSYRLFAAILDNAAATILFFVAAMSLATEAPIQWLPAVAGISAYLGYYFVTEWLFGTTPGKRLMGLCVRQVSGERSTVSQIGIRT